MHSSIGVGESMKSIVAKGIQTEMGSPYGGTGFVTEKMYMLLQLYIQNKGWNQVELQYISESKDGSMLPSAAYVQMMASRMTLDSQGRLILRDNGKIILPFEHFANAVMLKHMNGPHGLHLGLEGTLRAVMDSYTIGRENFGMEKEFIVEVVNNCPNPACRFYKSQLDISHNKPTYIPEPSRKSGSIGESSTSDMDRMSKGTPLPPSQNQHKLSDFLKSSLDNLDSLTSANKDLLAVHNGAWLNQETTDGKKHASSNTEVGQEKIIRAFSEIMKNMTRIKTFVRPAMCKPYGKQSEALQKTIIDTIQLVQSLRLILPPPHIAVSSWKNEDKHRKGVPGLDEFCESIR
ncbi:uncharacterized protein LOC106663183 isoform X3 [Cimex lectularius]|uniref:Genetic suppressor element-like domain-containing protein n=1 Tax=Cimex lectularius TaxID=79782 RepID=A0A8I6TE90_CIMLE|nr:uncharacterized protein LOC106663183 isoform X3 [Cimex lectularius]